MRNRTFILPCENWKKNRIVICNSPSKDGAYLLETQHYMSGSMGVTLSLESIEKLRDQLNVILEESK